MSGALLIPWLWVVVALWSLAAVGGLGARRGWPTVLALLGWLGLAALIITLWLTLDRPPLRTLGETRLWYASGLVATGLIVSWRFARPGLLPPMLLMGAGFLLGDAVQPTTLDRTLMPALRSPWFVPHVVLYLTSYAVLGSAAVLAGWSLLRRRAEHDDDVVRRLLHLGLPLLTCGLCLGAVWAKEAWGHYWAWDPKETWALLTWITYVAVIHTDDPARPRRTLILASTAFVVVLACWFVVNALPAAQVSVHTYTRA